MFSLQQRFDRMNILIDEFTNTIRWSDISYMDQDVFIGLLDKMRSELYMIKKHMPSSVEQ